MVVPTPIILHHHNEVVDAVTYEYPRWVDIFSAYSCGVFIIGIMGILVAMLLLILQKDERPVFMASAFVTVVGTLLLLASLILEQITGIPIE